MLGRYYISGLRKAVYIIVCTSMEFTIFYRGITMLLRDGWEESLEDRYGKYTRKEN